jgi:hypothetical protein
MRRSVTSVLVGVAAMTLVLGLGVGPAAAELALSGPVPAQDNDGKPDRPKDDGVPKGPKLRKFAEVPPPLDPTVVLYRPHAAPSPAVYGEDITVIPEYADGNVGADGLDVLPTCALAQAVIDANYAAGDYPAGLTCDGAVAKPGFTVVAQPVTADISITPAALSVTASSADSAYGTVPAITPTYDGFQRGDTPDQLTTQASCTTTATATSSPGPFTSTCANAASKNYTFTYVDGAVNIVAAALTITPSNGTATYGAVPAITPNFTGLVNGTGSLTTQPTCVTTATATTGAGTYTDSTSCSGAASPNYTITYGPAGTTTINPAALTVTAVGQSRLVGQPNSAFSANFAGFVNGQNQSALGGTLAFTTEATQNSGPGSYPLLPSGLSSPNYVISFVPGTIKVTATPPITPTPTPTPTTTPTKSPTPTPTPTRTNTNTPTPPPTPSGGGWPLWLTILVIGGGLLVIALIVVGIIAMNSRRGAHEA